MIYFIVDFSDWWNNVFLSYTVFFALLAGIIILLTAWLDRKESKSQYKTIKQVFKVISAFALIAAAMADKYEKNITDQKNTALNLKNTALTKSLLTLNTRMDSVQNIISTKQTVIDRKQNEINSQNRNISKLQNNLIDTTQIIAQLAIKNSQLQEELLRQANSSKSFPLLFAAITDAPKHETSTLSPDHSVLRLVFYLKNIGKYDLNNINVNYDLIMRNNYIKQGELMGEYHLNGHQEIPINDEILKNVITYQSPYPYIYKFTVTWKTYRYYLMIRLPLEMVHNVIDINALDQYYYNDIKGFKSKGEFIDSMLKEIN
jgi:hypothetical protein